MCSYIDRTSCVAVLIVAIDGPAGSGKSSTARRVADVLGYYYMDSGMMYRGVALALLRQPGIREEQEVRKYLAAVPLEVTFDGDVLCLHLDGEDIRPRLRDPAVSAKASAVARLQAVRAALVGMQRTLGVRYGNAPGLVVEGRDMGTVVFPEAPVKIFMTASLDVRARRRHNELVSQGYVSDLADVLASIAARDRQDVERRLSPLRKAPDALVLDTDHCSMDAQVAFVVAQVLEQTV